MLAINLTGVFHVSRATIPHLRAAGGGAIVNVASQFGLVGCLASPAYCASKAGLIGLTRAMAIDHTSEGIRVNCVCPGPIDTPMLAWTAATPELTARERARTAGPQPGRPLRPARGDRGDHRVHPVGRGRVHVGQHRPRRRRLDGGVDLTPSRARARRAGTRRDARRPTQRPSATTRSPRASTSRTRPGTSMPSYGVQSSPSFISSSVSRVGADGSQTTRSASLPGATIALARIEPEDPRGLRAGGVDQPLDGERSRRSAEREPERQPRADPGKPGRDLGEVVLHRHLVAVEPQVAVVGGVGRHVARPQPLQERRPVGGRAQRRRHHVAQRVRPLVVASARRAGGASTPRACTVCPRRRAARISSSGSRPVTWTTYGVAPASPARTRNRCTHSASSSIGRLAGSDSMPSRPSRDALPRQEVDRAAVLAVGERDDPELGGLLHHRERDVVVGHDPELDVGQPQLDAADAERRGVGEVAAAVRLRLPDHGVEGEVDVRLGHLVGERPARRLGGALARQRVDERERGGRPAAQRRAGVGRDAAEGMGVHVDAPGQDEAARRVDHVGGRRVDAADLDHHAVLDEHVARAPSRPARRPCRRRSPSPWPATPPPGPAGTAPRRAAAGCSRRTASRAPRAPRRPRTARPCP